MDKKGIYLNEISSAIENVETIPNGEISISIKTTPNKGNLSYLKKETTDTINLTFTKENNNTFYECILNEEYDGIINNTKVKYSKEGLFSYDNNNWEKIYNENLNYYDSIIDMIRLDYKKGDIDNASVSEKDSFKIYTVTISPDKLSSKNLSKLTYTYWLNAEDNLSRLIVRQEGQMIEDSNKDLFTTVFDISINRKN